MAVRPRASWHRGQVRHKQRPLSEEDPLHEIDIPSPEIVRAAAARLAGVAHRTPVFHSESLDHTCGARVYLKAESLQRSGSFKFRGAWSALSNLSDADRARGVLTFSSGNHAAALALAGRIRGVHVVVALPTNALLQKRASILDYGAEIVPCAPAERERVSAEVAAARGLVVIPPYDHWDVIAGQGTSALELLEDEGPFDLLLAPVGGGGLLAGTALAARLVASERGSRTEIVGVEPARGDDAARSLVEGAIVRLAETPETIADGLRTRFIGERNFAVLRGGDVRIVTVSEPEISDALRFLWMRTKLVVEPSSAVPVAALLAKRIDVRGQRVGVILSGGNIDPTELLRSLAC